MRTYDDSRAGATSSGPLSRRHGRQVAKGALPLVAVLLLVGCVDRDRITQAEGMRLSLQCEGGTAYEVDLTVQAARLKALYRDRFDIDGMRELLAAEGAADTPRLRQIIHSHVCEHGPLPKEVDDLEWPDPGAIAPSVTLAQLDTLRPHPVVDSVRIPSATGRPMVIDVMASWCLPCRDIQPILAELAREYRPRGVDFYSVVYKDAPRLAMAFIERYAGHAMPVLVEDGSGLGRLWGIRGIPAMFVLDADGRLVSQQLGSANIADRLPVLLDSLVSENPSR